MTQYEAESSAQPPQFREGNWIGAVLAQYFKFDLTAALEVGDTVVLCRIPPGSRVLGLYVTGSNHVGEATLAADIGDGIVASKYAAAAALNNGAGAKLSIEDGLMVSQPFGAALTLTPTAGSDQSSGSIEGYIMYAVPANFTINA